MSSYTFLIVGASSGIGLSLTIVALKAGHKVIATARNPDKARADFPEVERLGGIWLALDITKEDTESIVKSASEKHGVDVLVNSAGYALLGPIEDMSDDEIHAQMNTNFYGYLRTIKGIVPSLRNGKGGVIMNISSGAGLVGTPARGMYSASKFALEGASEALAGELKPFNIKVIICDLGAFRTNMSNNMLFPAKGVSKCYEGTEVERVFNLTKNILSNPRMNSADKAAHRMLDMVTGTGMCADEEVQGCLRLVLGEDCTKALRYKVDNLAKNGDLMEKVAASTLEDEN